MARLSINAAPTFKAKVGIPMPGGEPVEVDFVFKHRTKDQLDEFVGSRSDKSDAETFLDMVSGWDFAEDFSESAVKTMVQNYIGAALEVYKVYIAELVKAKVKN